MWSGEDVMSDIIDLFETYYRVIVEKASRTTGIDGSNAERIMAFMCNQTMKIRVPCLLLKVIFTTSSILIWKKPGILAFATPQEIEDEFEARYEIILSKRQIKTSAIISLINQPKEVSNATSKRALFHGPGRPDKAYGAVSVPIYQTSTFVYDDIGKSRGYTYSREANPTRQALEQTLADLEGGKRGFAFASGMAAESAVAHLLKAGDHVICVVDPYGGTYRLFKDIMPQYGITASFAPLASRMTIDWAMQAETKMVWIESPTNPLLNIVDLKVVPKSPRAITCSP